MDSELVRDIGIVLFIMILANFIFNKFEKHLAVWRRITKHGTLFLIITLIRIYLGQYFFFIILGLLTLGQIILHAWWFPQKGINGFTAEPYEKYLKLIHKKKKIE